MNKSMKTLTVALLVVLAFVQLGAVAAFADEGGDTYTIRIFAGSGGATVNGQNMDVIYAHYDEEINLAQYVSPGIGGTTNGGRYYVKCIRESGLDNDVLTSGEVHVTEDADYVVGYGIPGNLVACPVLYLEEGTERELHAPQTYYGNVGDKPIISYLYVDGYQPQAYNLTKTLRANEEDNTFIFWYKPIVQPTAVPAPTSAPSGGTSGGGTGTGGGSTGGGSTGGGVSGGTGLGGTVVGGGSTGGAPATARPAGGTAATAQPGTTAAPADQNGAEATAAPDEQPAEATEQPAEETAEPTEAPTEELEEEQTPLDEGPKDLIDLDEEETPLGEAPKMPQQEKSELQKDREQKQTKFYIAVALLAASLTGIVVAVVLVIKKSRAEQR